MSSRLLVAAESEFYFASATNIKNLKLENSNFRLLVTPRVGFEPTTNRLTADRSATELPRIGAFCLPHLLIVIPTS